MLPCISPVPVILHTVEPPRKTRIGPRNLEFEKSKMESTEIKAKGNNKKKWFEFSGARGSRKRIPLYKHLTVNFMSKLTGITDLVKYGTGAIKKMAVSVFEAG